VTQTIERGFLQNNPAMLYVLFPENGHINISFSEPISFSDQISSQQSYFLFKKIFSTYSTFEFYSDREAHPNEENSFIFKTRWSFRDNKNGNQYVFRVFFYLLKTTNSSRKDSLLNWKILEIKAEKI
jgi:hypothetical protein